jgi:hypothetical protein
LVISKTSAGGAALAREIKKLIGESK